jgi:hypothetical protein
MDGAEYCRAHIQNWLQGATILERSAQRIFAVADKILKVGIEREGEVASGPYQNAASHFQNDSVSLRKRQRGPVECTLKASREKVAIICATMPVGEHLVFIPLTQLFPGNPYESIHMPTAEGGALMNKRIALLCVSQH